MEDNTIKTTCDKKEHQKRMLGFVKKFNVFTESITVNIYDRDFVVLPGIHKPDRKITSELYEKSEINCSDIVLEMGCGCGVLSVLFAFKCRNILAIDINNTAIMNTEMNCKSFLLCCLPYYTLLLQPFLYLQDVLLLLTSTS